MNVILHLLELENAGNECHVVCKKAGPCAFCGTKGLCMPTKKVTSYSNSCNRKYGFTNNKTMICTPKEGKENESNG